MLSEKTLLEFSAELSSDSPAPGGGSVAALAGSLGADLLSMICNLTIGKKGFEAVNDEFVQVQTDAVKLSSKLMGRVDSDTQAFNGVMAAFRLPKGTDEEKAVRREAIQKGYKEAVDSPLGIATDCLAVLNLLELVFGKFNPNTMSDYGVAAQLAKAGVEGGIMNVNINLPSIKDEAFVQHMKEQVRKLQEQAQTIAAKIFNYVSENLA